MDKLFPEKYLPKKTTKKKKKYLPQIVKDIRNYIPGEIDYSFQKNISYSQLSMYDSCPKKWALRYKEGNKVFSSSIHTVFGTSIHHTIQHYLDVMYAESGAEADRIELMGYFEDKFRDEYQEQYKKNNSQHFSTSDEMREFYNDGVAILDYFRSNKSKYFSKKGWYLMGCEIPILQIPNPKFPNAIFQGYIDVVMYHEPTNTVKIIDIKTSTRSWGQKQKKDKSKQDQLLLYKHFFSEQFKFPIDNIEIEFFIVKRKIDEDAEWVQKRIQIFEPTSGKTSINRAKQSLNNFVNSSYDKDGYSSTDHQATPNPFTCKYCPFINTSLCKDGFTI